MLSLFCLRPKTLILNSPALFAHGFNVHHRNHLHGGGQHYDHLHLSTRRLSTPVHRFPNLGAEKNRRIRHSIACEINASRGGGGGAASIWHAILPSAACGGNPGRWIGPLFEKKGEGSWNVAWDARPARWLHRADSAWLLFGVCTCLVPVVDADPVDEKIEVADSISSELEDGDELSSSDYKVTGVVADGRCLFRAIVTGACLRRGEWAPDENHQRKLADELRAQVADELVKRRQESEWFIEGDFDAYVKRIQQPYVWGGEPELLMASHVLKTMISVFMGAGSISGELVKIANYGEEYGKVDESPINLLFHGYGHYELLEHVKEEGNKKKVNA